MLDGIPFWARAAFLAGLMTLAGALDWFRHGRAATRPREYAFIWFTGLIGCLIGGATDLITSSLSSEYFVLGKGLAAGEGLAWRATLFGFQEGLSAGVIAGAICVYVSRRKSKSPPLGFVELSGLICRPVVCAAAGAVLLPLVARDSDPAGVLRQFYTTALALGLDEGVAAAQTRRCLQVWWIHTGLYAGLVAGLVWVVVAVARRRRTNAGRTKPEVAP
jgi:hypothetical protein